MVTIQERSDSSAPAALRKSFGVDGDANTATQDSFCAGTSCVITIIYDQSGYGNSVAYQGTGGTGGHDTAANATSESFTVAGNKVYSLYINPGNSSVRTQTTFWQVSHTSALLIVSKQDSKRSVGQ